MDKFRIGEVYFIKQDPSTLDSAETSKIRPYVITSRYICNKVNYIVLSPASSQEKRLDFFGAVIVTIQGKAGVLIMGQSKKQLVMREEKFDSYRGKHFVGKLSEDDILDIQVAIERHETVIDDPTGQVRNHPLFKPKRFVTRLYENKCSFSLTDTFSILDKLTEKYLTEEHSFDSAAGYRGVGCKNLPEETIQKIINTDHSQLVVAGNAILELEHFDTELPAKLVVDGNTLWDYLYYRGGTKDKPVTRPVYTISDLNGKAAKFFTNAVAVEDTILIINKNKKTDKYFVSAIWHDSSNNTYRIQFGLPEHFIKF